MAVIQYKVRDQFVEELELSFSASEHYSDQISWVKAKVAFRFWSGFPETAIERSGQDFSDVERLIHDLRGVVKENKPVDFYPMEPDYHISVVRDGDSYEITVTLDATGSQTTGVYCGVGPTMILPTDGNSLLKFADDLEKELGQVKQTSKEGLK